MHPRPPYHIIRIPTLKTLWNNPILLLTISLLINTITATILLHQAQQIRTRINRYNEYTTYHGPEVRKLLSTPSDDANAIRWAYRYEITSFYLILLNTLLIIRTINNGKQNGPGTEDPKATASNRK